MSVSPLQCPPLSHEVELFLLLSSLCAASSVITTPQQSRALDPNIRCKGRYWDNTDLHRLLATKLQYLISWAATSLKESITAKPNLRQLHEYLKGQKYA